MFVYSIKTSKGKMLLGLGIAAAVIILLILLFSGGEPAETVSTKSKIDYSATTAEKRVSFLEQFGWEVKSEPVSVTEELIPEEFDTSYEEYNTIQKMQSLDLSKYKGKRVKRWTYEITNYPGTDETVYANLLVLNGKVIGGDVSSAEKDGFMHGFAGDTQTGAGVDVVYELSEDGTLIVQNDISGVETPGAAAGDDSAGENGTGNGGTGTGSGSGGSGNGGTGSGSSGNGGTGSGSNGEASEEVSNPQTGDIWEW